MLRNYLLLFWNLNITRSPITWQPSYELRRGLWLLLEGVLYYLHVQEWVHFFFILHNLLCRVSWLILVETVGKYRALHSCFMFNFINVKWCFQCGFRRMAVWQAVYTMQDKIQVLLLINITSQKRLDSNSYSVQRATSVCCNGCWWLCMVDFQSRLWYN